jgi:hypothetical protein
MKNQAAENESKKKINYCETWISFLPELVRTKKKKKKNDILQLKKLK